MSRAAIACVVGLFCPACNSGLGGHDTGVDGGTAGDATTYACTIDTDCADPHAYCNTQLESHACDCVAGYSLAGDGDCQWSGVVADPGFQHGSDSWVLTGGGYVDATGSGDVDPGFAFLGCPSSGWSALAQTVTMPRLSRAQPLVLTMTAQSAGGAGAMAWSSEVGGVWSRTAFAQDEPEWTTTRVCLGAGQYAPESTSGSGAQSPISAVVTELFRCDAEPDRVEDVPEVDHFEIVPAEPGECPDPGTVANGSGEGSGGWQFQTSASSDDTSAGIVAGVGEGSSAGVQLVITEGCDRAAASTSVSVPLPDASGSPMLSFYHRSTSTAGAYLEATIDDNSFALAPDTTGVVERYCLPSYLAGGVYAFETELVTSGLVCGTAFDASAVIDNVEIANDPSCAATNGVADGGFESAASVPGFYEPGGSLVTIQDDALAHGGSRDLKIQVTAGCTEADYSVPIVAPITGGGGPTLTFWYNGAGQQAQGVVSGATLTLDGLWHQAATCLSEAYSGIPETIVVGLLGLPTGTDACDLAIPAQMLLLDDFALTTSPACGSTE